MKKYILLSFVIISALFMSCEEEFRGPLVDDGIPPKPVSNVAVENIPGGATLTYTLPDDEDALYVLAEYTLKSGAKASAKSTIYRNELTILGFGDTDAQNVTVYAVDRGENQSPPIEVTINPLEPPVQTINNSMILLPDFGGVHLFWDNETEAEIAVIVMTEDSTGNLYQVDLRYSGLLQDHFAVRGFGTELRKFYVLVRDRWDNFSDTTIVELNPLFEEKLNKDDFTFMKLPHDAPDAWSWVGPNLFNYNIGGSGFHTPQGWTDPDPLPEYENNIHMFTMDLGVTAKLSRFKFWQRQGTWIFRHGNPQYFEVWGATELNSSGSFDGWTKLIENGEVVKPSGLPPGQYSNDDAAQAAAGEEYPFPLDSEPVRYIRFVCENSFSGGQFIHIMEVDFWGQIAE